MWGTRRIHLAHRDLIGEENAWEIADERYVSHETIDGAGLAVRVGIPEHHSDRERIWALRAVVLVSARNPQLPAA
jgi:hypothetical protein